MDTCDRAPRGLPVKATCQKPASNHIIHISGPSATSGSRFHGNLSRRYIHGNRGREDNQPRPPGVPGWYILGTPGVSLTWGLPLRPSDRVSAPASEWRPGYRRSLAVCRERPKLMREADRQSGETSCKTDVIITIATSHHRHRSSPSLSPPPSPSEITGPIGREEGGHQRQRHGRRHRRHGL